MVSNISCGKLMHTEFDAITEKFRLLVNYLFSLSRRFNFAAAPQACFRDCSVNILRAGEIELLIRQRRGGRVVNARALRARGSQGPHGFESHPRRLFTDKSLKLRRTPSRRFTRKKLQGTVAWYLFVSGKTLL